MPRLFTAIEIPEAVRTQLSLLGAPMNGARWLDAELMHITLRFAGDVDRHAADEWAYLLERIEAPAFDLSIAGLGVFGGHQPKSIWASVQDSGGDLARLHGAHERAARAACLPPQPRAFKPHVTLARLRGTKPRAVADFLEARGGFRTPPFRVNRVVLLSSKPGTGGGPYAIEDAYPLVPPFETHDNDNWAAR